jgi:hypothetical protein
MLDALTRFVSTLVRIALTLAGVAVAGAMLLVGIGVAIGLIGWSLLRGRRPAFGTAGLGGFRGFRMGPGFGAGARSQWRTGAAEPRRPRAPVEVIDIDARVVSEPAGAKRTD